jgi:hypothetical protein
MHKRSRIDKVKVERFYVFRVFLNETCSILNEISLVLNAFSTLTERKGSRWKPHDLPLRDDPQHVAMHPGHESQNHRPQMESARGCRTDRLKLKLRHYQSV